jgi:tyrosyl-tRNA synthetase
MPGPDDLALFARGAVDLIERRDLEARLAENRPLRVKFGMDPSSPDLHVGHCVQLFKLRALQDAGHQIVLIVGDSTAMVGDPSGRNKLRPQLSREEVEKNLETYTAQVGHVLDMARTEVHKNSEWFDAMKFEDVLRLAGRMTVARMLERDTFEQRVAAKEPIGIHEFLYPLMQGWDSVQIRCDVELGGTDQLFNLLVGRLLQEQVGQPAQICMTLPLINGLDGRKMSKSYGNAIGLTDGAKDMYHKVTRVENDALPAWYTLLTPLAEGEIDAILAGDLIEAKQRLASEITSFFHGPAALAHVRDVPEVSWPAEQRGHARPLANLLVDLGLAESTSKARQLVQQGGVRVNEESVSDPLRSYAEKDLPLEIHVGKRRSARVRAG